MNVLASMRIALRALRINKLRSALTMLGIIIGVAAVITMIAVGSGAQAQIENQIKGLGTNLIILMPGSSTSGGVRMGAGSRNTLTEEDGYAIQRDVPAVQASAPTLRGSGQVVIPLPATCSATPIRSVRLCASARCRSPSSARWRKKARA